MTNFSTLVYLINNFQTDLDAVNFETLETSFESSNSKQNFSVATPREGVVNNILNFARSYDVLKTETTGYVEMNLN